VMSCIWCGRALSPEEQKDPRDDGDGSPICDKCFDEWEDNKDARSEMHIIAYRRGRWWRISLRRLMS